MATNQSVGLLFPSYSNAPTVDARQEPIWGIAHDPDGDKVVLSFPVNGTDPKTGRPRHGRAMFNVPVSPSGQPMPIMQGPVERLAGWGWHKLGDTVYALVPSIQTPQFHAFVILCDVPPDCAPFRTEKKAYREEGKKDGANGNVIQLAGR